MKIGTKLTLAMSVIVVVMGLLTVAAIHLIIGSALRQDLQQKGLALTGHLADYLAKVRKSSTACGPPSARRSRNCTTSSMTCGPPCWLRCGPYPPTWY